MRQFAGIHQRIQQAGFADVAAPQKGDFSIAFRGKLLRSGCTYYKPGGHEESEARNQESESVGCGYHSDS